jgi:hypothetical protein
MDSVSTEASSEVGKELCRLASSSIRPVSTSPEAPSAGPKHVPYPSRRHYWESLVDLHVISRPLLRTRAAGTPTSTLALVFTDPDCVRSACSLAL